MKKIEYIEVVNTNGKDRYEIEVSNIKDIYIEEDSFNVRRTVILTDTKKYYTNSTEFEVKTKIVADRIERESMLIW